MSLKRKTYAEMETMIRDIHDEIKRRNPIGVNMYTGYLLTAASAVKEISEGEAGNFTSECGPKEPERNGRSK